MVTFEPREIDDPRVMRALAHPLRIRLLELLTIRGPLTATQCAEHVGESPASCSFHLRMLAKYGFLEEAEGGAGRARPWRVVSLGNRWQAGPAAPAGARAAADALSAQIRRRDREALEDYIARADEFDPEWADAVVHSNWGSYLTADELAAIGEQLAAIWAPYIDRLSDPGRRPAGSQLVSMFAHAFPRVEGLDDPAAPAPIDDEETGDA